MFRVEKVNLRSNTEIQFKFNKELDPNLTILNVSIVSSVPSVEPLTVKSIRVKKSVLSVVTNQQQPMVLYQVLLLDTPTQPFQSKDKESPQNLNSLFFIGQEKTNDIRDSVLEILSQVYNVDHATLVRKIISGLSDRFLKARTDIKEIGSANYLSELVTDEIYQRGYGPTDRLTAEGAFDLIRVGKTATGTTNAKKISFTSIPNQIDNLWNTSIPSDPISLRSIQTTETVSNQETALNKFDGLLLTLSKSNIAVVLSVSIGDIEYNIQKYGYALQSNRYDTRFGRNLVSLDSNQVRLSDAAAIDGSFPVPSSNSEIKITYVYLDNGINVDSTTIEISQVRTVARERVPSLLNVFNLAGFPIVTSQDVLATRNGVVFLDPEPVAATPFTVTHPAFQTEIPFSVNRMPDRPGQFSVDYETGRVFVYGATSENDGTGHSPPVASYLYRRIFSQAIDYNFSSDTDEVAASPTRDLAGQAANIRFRYEQVLSPGVDYTNECHIEVHDEFVENRFNGQNAIYPLKRPITNVFEVFNETTGERYTVLRATDDVVYFNGFSLPRFTDHNNEIVNFAQVSAENLYGNDELFNNGTQKIIKISLQNQEIISASGYKQGSSTNSSVIFSRPDVFVRQFYFDNILESLSDNLSKIVSVGDYLVNHEDGVIYLRTNSDEEDFGTIEYKYGAIKTNYSQIISVASVDYRSTIKSDPVLSLGVDEFTSELIVPQKIPEAIERFFAGVSDQPILFGSVAYGIAGQMHVGSYEFIAPEGNFDSSYVDGFHILRITGEPDRAITAVTSETTLLVDIPFTEFNLNASWSIIDFELSDGYKTSTTYDIKFVNGVYRVDELQTLPTSDITNFYDPMFDRFSGKEIFFNSEAIKSLPPGTALAIDYSFGGMYVNYTVATDVLRVSYEYGDNSINFSNSESLSPEEQYFVTYKFGALREKLLENFGSLTQVQELTDFPVDLNRELYRGFLLGTLQGFLRGPTVDSIKDLVEDVTEIRPNIREFDFGQWILGRDNLFLVKPKLSEPAKFDTAKYGNGLVFDGKQTLMLPGESYISFREGSFEAWVKPYWNGIDNDATLSFDINDSADNIFIGARAYNPTEIPFTVNKGDAEPKTSIGQPINFGTLAAHYIWYDDINNRWNYVATKDGYGEITTSGEMYHVLDGYNITSTDTYIKFDGYSDQRDGYTVDGYEALWWLKFNSDDVHRVFDTGPDNSHNRMTMYKNGSGYLCFKIYDNRQHIYGIAHNIQDWFAGDLHFVCASWRLNTVEAVDELHLFVDGQEVSNLFRYGGKPQVAPENLYGEVADEYLTMSAIKTIIGNNDGQSTSSSTEFKSLATDFIAAGIVAGDSFAILDDTIDGVNGPYSIISVQQHTVVINSPLTLTLDNVRFSVNKQSFVSETNSDTERIAIFTSVDGYERTELSGVSALEPDYSIDRNSGQNIITIINNVEAGDQIIVNTLGLNCGRCRDQIYLYRDDGYQIQTRGAAPVSLEHFDVFKIQFPRTSIEDGYGPYGDGYGSFQETSPNVFQGSFTNIIQPSNQTNGKKLSAILGGQDNIDFSGVNQVTYNGTTFGGPVSETVSFTSYGTQTTINFFTSLSSIDMTFTSVNDGYSLGSITVMESVPFTKEENNGDYAIPIEYDNGVFSFAVFGAISMPWILQHGWYLLDYPTALSIKLDQKGPLFIGSSIEKTEQFNGVIDQVIFLNEKLSDIRKGEDINIQRSITSDYNSPIELDFTSQTLLDLNLNDKVDNVSNVYKSFDTAFHTSSFSVNTSFGDSIVFHKKPYIIDNASVVFDSNNATVEFWVSPYLDTNYDFFNRYYLDISSFVSQEITSTTAHTFELPQRAKKIVSIRLASDVFENGQDFSVDSKLFVNGTTVFIGSALPNKNTLVRVVYVPIESQGNRISIYRTTSGLLNYSVISGDNVFVISVPIDWKRNTWHRVKALLKANTTDDMDQMRLFVDGQESGVIRWGTPGLLYGSGFVYGSAAVGTSDGQAITANIDLTDTLSSIYLGNSFDQLNPAKCRMDNVRFSNSIRQPSIIATIPMDLNYSSSLATVSPVVEDDQTTILLDFDRNIEKTDFLANLISKYTPLYLFDVEIDDSFRHLTDQRARNIMSSILHRMKQSHTNIFIKYLQDL